MNTAADQLELADHSLSRAEVRRLMVEGLGARPKTLPCKLLYDARGSELFEQICELEEYYPTRTEIGIFRRHVGEMAGRLGSRRMVIEFGSGAGVKSRLLLDALDRPVAFVPIEISREALRQSCAELAPAYPRLEVLPVCADYTEPVTLPTPREAPAGRMVFFPGSTIGNFQPAQAQRFLRRCREMVGPGGSMLIGVDLVKDPAVLEAAYDDAKGVTAAFNLNLLHRANREADSDFDVSAFEHRAVWNAAASRIEMHLVSRRSQTVHVAGRAIDFAAGETILTECSHKYTPADFAQFARRAGCGTGGLWTDPRDWFSIHLLLGV